MKRPLFVLSSSLAMLLVACEDAPPPPAVGPDGKPVRAPNAAMQPVADRLVTVTVTPETPFGFDVMKVGALQHLDRDYTYDVVPEELVGGLLYQGVHRAPLGTEIRFELKQPATVYAFFHDRKDGGWGKVFPGLADWKLCPVAPQYDIHNGDHGWRMFLYARHFEPGSYALPATVKDQGCFNVVFQPDPAPAL